MNRLRKFFEYLESDDSDLIYQNNSSEPIPDTEEVKKSISFAEAKDWILDNYDDERVIEMLDNAKLEYIDYEQMKDEGYESEYDYYVDYGRGEAESDVVEDIVSDVKYKFNLSFNPFDDDTNLYAFLRDVFDCLDF